MNIKKRGGFSALVSSSKAQLSIFMIMAALIILIGVIYFFYQREEVEKREVEIVQPEIMPVKAYVENCLKGIADDGLQRIGLSGGYIKIPEKIGNNPAAYLATFSASGFKIPYWWHNGIDAVPPQEFIRQQLIGYIESELDNCINKFEPFAGIFKIDELEKPAADVKFNENDVSVNLKYPLEISAKNGGFKAYRENFAYIAPVRFKKVYELAKLIMERENKDYFLEKKTIDLYSMDKSIPTTDVEAKCGARIWQLSAIKKKLKSLLRVNLPYIKIKGADYNPNIYVPNPKGKSTFSNTYFQQHYIWEIEKDDNNKYKNMKVVFAYDDKWLLDIYARPSQDGILKSNSQKGADILSFFCLQIWHFTYDVNYPVLATIFDNEAKDNKKYQFNFAFKVAVDHNKPNRANTGTALFETVPDLSPEDYCNDVQNEITIYTVNNATGEDIKDVNLTFVCGRFYCDIGQSNWLSFGAAAGITKRLPYCVNGVLKYSKQGFETASSFVQTDVDGRSYVVMLNPVKEFSDYKVVRHSLSSPSSAEELAPNEKASISIKGQSIGFESFAVYPKDSEFPLKLADGRDAVYDVSVYVADDENLIGGYIGEWKVSKDSLSGANKIVFHVIEQGPASDDERALFISGLSSYSKKVPAPELK